ncbi:MAG: response regulator [Nautiliaceae bacterium]
MKILIVEDDEFSSVVLKELIEILYPGVKVYKAENGKEALEMVKKESFDLIFSDIRMPVMDGYAFIKEFKKHFKTPVIAVTAFAIKGDKEKILSSGFDGYISKPIDIDELKKTINKFLEKK